MIKSYQLDENGVLQCENPEYTQQPYNSVLVRPPAPVEGKVLKWVTSLNPVTALNFGHVGTGQWVQVTDNRNKQLYNKSDGSPYVGDFDGLGDLPEGITDKSPPSVHHSWDGTDWVLTPEKQAQLAQEELDTAKTAKLLEINNKAQAFIDTLASLNEVPDFEVRTWVKQAQEAYAWEQNKESPTPTLDLIALGRGVDRVELITKALQKAKQFDVLVSHTAGVRQRYEDQLKAALVLDDVNAIDPIYTLPEAI